MSVDRRARAKPPSQDSSSLPSVLPVEIYQHPGDKTLWVKPLDGREAPPIRLQHPGRKEKKDRYRVKAGDTALVRLHTREDTMEKNTPQKAGEAQTTYTAHIITRLNIGPETVLCYAEGEKASLYLVPVERHMREVFKLSPSKNSPDVRAGDLCMAAPVRPYRRGTSPRARVLNIVGHAKGSAAYSLIALRLYEAPSGFSKEEEKQAKACQPVHLEGRLDLREKPFVTIDPNDARDHDDAVFAEQDTDPANPGGHILWVAIADVAAYVTPGSALDKGAYERGFSIYLPDRVEAMLPERLSTDLCSLKEDEDRPCLAVRLVFDARGEKKDHSFHRAMMRSAARLTYIQAQKAFDGTPCQKTIPLMEKTLQPLWKVYQDLKKARERRQPLDLDPAEYRLILGEDGHVEHFEPRMRLEAHRLVEESMIQANCAAAETLQATGLSTLYRVHPAPSEEKLEGLSHSLSGLSGLSCHWAPDKEPDGALFNTLLQQARTTPSYHLVQDLVMRAQMQAFYHQDNTGHFGLNLSAYTHFTSPIRRYSDLLVHRALITSLSLGKGGEEYTPSLCEEMAEHLSFAERRASSVERGARERFITSFLRAHTGEVFEGRISGVSRSGLFIRLEDYGAEGFIPARFLSRGRLLYDDKNRTLTEVRSGGVWTFGGPVKIRLKTANPVSGGLLFENLTPAEKRKKGKKSNKKQASHRTSSRTSHARRKKGQKGPPSCQT